MSRHRSLARRRTGASALLAAALIVVASACSAGGGGAQDVSTGPGGTPASGISYLNRAAVATNEVQTLKVAVETTVSGVGTGPATTTTTGEVDRAARRAHLEVDATDTLSGFDGDAELPDGAGVLELVVDGDTAYLRSPLYASFTGSDKAWVSASRNDLGGDRPGAATGQGDPGDLLALLEGAGGTLTELGREDVRGVPTRHVSTVIDLEKALAQLPDDRHRDLVEELRGYGAEASSFVTIPAEAWVDDDGHVRRFTLTLDFAPAGDEVPELADAAVVVTAELYDLDVPVEIEVPDPADVAELDLTALLSGD